ncbi:MAG: inorganic phosphate transporter [Chloroflexi bacterium]|nr:MAG: inorganic phosphate transporter [Chloroflexota bacterium]
MPALDASLLLLFLIIALGLAFDFINGFHDTANAVATSIATRVLSPGRAVLMAGVLNFVGALSGTAVATTIGKGIVPPDVATQTLVISALVAAITWNLVTWYFGLPSSSSHALVFSIVGAGVAAGGWSAIQFGGLEKTFQGLVFSPLLGFGAAFLVMFLLLNAFAKAFPATVTRVFGRAQLVSAAWMAFSHGGNDAQKTMGVITMALASYYGWDGTRWEVPLWVMLAAAMAMGLGTAVGGWRIIKTMGLRVVELRPIHGFAAETAAATVIEVASRMGIPVSTTHTIGSAIMGVGSTRRRSSVRWGVGGQIVTGWLFTIPACFTLAWTARSMLGLVGA